MDLGEWMQSYFAMLRRVVPQLGEEDISSVESALCEVLGLEDHRDLVGRDLPDEEVLRILRSFDFRKFHPELLAEIEMDEPELPKGVPLLSLVAEADFPINGRVWRIYRNDVDPFPSNPHAHWVAKAWKLDLRNGDAYLRRTFVGWSLRRKELNTLRALAEQRGIAMPPLALG